jgi:pimeloyl-ACP methyl ester carboxylesterase
METPRDFTPFEFLSMGYRCAAWDIPGDNAAGPLVVCTPGWADSKIGLLARLDALLPFASRVVVWDPPGLGETTGKWLMGTREHRMLLELVREVARADEARAGIVLLGWSAGAGTAIAAAALDAQGGTGETDVPMVSAVIAEAPYRFPWTPAFAVMRNAALPWRINGPFAFALLGVRLTGHPLWRGFDRVGFAPGVRCPLLLIHPVEDEVCPFADSQAIADVAPNATLIPITGAGHNNLWTEEPYRTDCAAAVADFLSAFAPPVPRPTVPPIPHEDLH